MSDSILGGTDEGTGNAGDGGNAGMGDGGGSSTTAPEWLSGIDGIDEELLGDPSLAPINSVNSLLKSFVNAQKMVGADKIIKPGEGAQDDEWSAVFHKLGKPNKIEDYKFAAPEKNSFEGEFSEAFKKAAYDAHLLPNQAKKLYESLNSYESDSLETYRQKQTESIESSVGELRSEWGQAFENKVTMAKRAAKELGGDDFITHLEQAGLGNDTKLIRFFAKVGDGMFQEDTEQTVGANTGTMTPEQASEKWAAIMNDSNDVYFHPGKPGHKARLEQVNKIVAAMG